MALILAFRAAEAAPPATRATPASPTTAELILFPGVRYERHACDPAAVPEAKSRNRRRTKQREMIDLMD